MLLSSCLSAWILDQRGNGAARNTQKLYTHVATLVMEYLRTELGRPPVVGDLTLAAAREFQAWLDETPYLAGREERRHSPRTLAQYSHVLKLWSSFLVHEIPLDGDPLERLRIPKVPQDTPTVLSKEQIKLLLRLCSESSDLGVRNKAIVWLLADSGMRVGELVQMHLGHLSYATAKAAGSVEIQAASTKSKRSRRVFFDLRCSKAVQKYIEESRPESRSPFVFLAQGGHALSTDAVRRMLRLLADEAGLAAKKVTPHQLRHSFATQMLRENPGAVLHVQQMLGHSRMTTTQRYVHLAAADLAESYHSPWG